VLKLKIKKQRKKMMVAVIKAIELYEQIRVKSLDIQMIPTKYC